MGKIDGDELSVTMAYDNGVVVATTDFEDIQGFPKTFTAKGMHDPRGFCDTVAKKIEREVGRPVKWTMVKYSRPESDKSTMNEEYARKFSSTRSPYELAIELDKEMTAQANGALERVKAFPDDARERDALLLAYLELEVMWSECENRLREIAATTTNTQERTALATKINQANEKSSEYEALWQTVVKNTTDTLSAQEVAESLKNAGQAMQKVGHGMTVGITIPIIVIIVLIVLLMILL